jgi:hypothetical protein
MNLPLRLLRGIIRKSFDKLRIFSLLCGNLAVNLRLSKPGLE